MALRLGFCFQPSSERGSTYRRKEYISHPSLRDPPGPALSHPRAPAFQAQIGVCSRLCLGQGTLALRLTWGRGIYAAPLIPGLATPTPPICTPSGRRPVYLPPGALVGELAPLPHRRTGQGRAAHLVA